MTTITQPPVATLRDGNLKLPIWKRSSETGDFYTVSKVVRSYKDGDTWKETDSLSGGQILRAIRLYNKAYDAIANLQATATQRTA